MSKYMKLAGKVLGGLVLLGLVGLIAIQFVPVNKSNPPVVSEPRWDSPQTQALAERACYDCHSNQTRWPWYSNIAPISWVLAHNVQEGRATLNFSELGLSKSRSAESNEAEGGENEEAQENEGHGRRQGEGGEGVEVNELIETIERGTMPPRDYAIVHPEAHLSDTEIQALITGLKATFASRTEGAMTK